MPSAGAVSCLGTTKPHSDNAACHHLPGYRLAHQPQPQVILQALILQSCLSGHHVIPLRAMIASVWFLMGLQVSFPPRRPLVLCTRRVKTR